MSTADFFNISVRCIACENVMNEVLAGAAVGIAASGILAAINDEMEI